MIDTFFDLDDTSCYLGNWEDILKEYDDCLSVEDFGIPLKNLIPYLILATYTRSVSSLS